jgi:hypothetical protein
MPSSRCRPCGQSCGGWCRRSMADLELVPRPDLILTAIGGGYLRNPIRRRHATCVVCTTPIASDFTRCFRCNSDRTQPGLADATALLTYAVADRESGHVMRGYKARPPVAEHRLIVARWIKQDYGDNKQFIADLRTLDYDPGICPWAGGGCP